MSAEPKTCAACGVAFVQAFDTAGEFCSRDCFRAGRQYCKFCTKLLPQSVQEAKRFFCDDLCSERYRRRGGPIHPSLLEEWHRSTCKACGKPFTQPPQGGRQFCDDTCSRDYHTAEGYELSLTEQWGTFAPEVRRSLRDIQFGMGIGAATRMAIAIDREYLLRRSISHSKVKLGGYIPCRCKTCGRIFQRREWGHKSRDYCSQKCVPHGDGEGVAAKLTWAEVDEIRVLHTAEHLSYEKIAEKYGVTASTIRAIITFKSWKPEQREGNRPRIGGPRKLTQEQAIEIRNLYEIEHFSQHKLAKRYGVAVSTIAQIVRYKTWNPEQVSLPKNALPWLLSGEAARHAKLTWQQVDEIRRLHTTEHLSNQRLGEMYGVTEGAIWHIVKGKTWKPENDPRRKEQPT